MHLLQDFTTIDGIPIIPNAWNAKSGLQAIGANSKVAAGLVSISFASMLGAMAVLIWASELWEFGKKMYMKRKINRYLNTAVDALSHGDYLTAATNYEYALDIERNPSVLMALGQVCAQHQSTRFKSHRTFAEAVDLLADQPARTMPYHGVQLSVRGLAGIQALSTVDVYEGLSRDHWNEYLSKLVLATYYSFKSAADKQMNQGKPVVKSALFSAAINYYLAAKSACQYPFLNERDDLVGTNLQAAQRALGLVAQQDEENLRPSMETMRQLWAYELLAPTAAR